eukprot:1568047-Pyramimonas_sp.AAC.1
MWAKTKAPRSRRRRRIAGSAPPQLLKPESSSYTVCDSACVLIMGNITTTDRSYSAIILPTKLVANNPCTPACATMATADASFHQLITEHAASSGGINHRIFNKCIPYYTM